MNNYNREEVEKLRDLIKDIDTAMLTTSTPEGLIARPMMTQEVEFDGDLWFFTMKDTDKYREILHDSEVNVSYAGKSYVSVSGKVEIVEDVDKKREYWNKAYEKMLETTVDDPNLVLLKVNVRSAEYWETGSVTKNAVNLFKKMTGKDEKDPADMNETIKFQ